LDRRQFIYIFAGGLLAAPLAAEGQAAGNRSRIGLLDVIAPSPSRQVLWDAFRQRLRELGYREGEQVDFEFRSAHGQPDSLAGLADALVRLRVDVIVAASTPAVLAAKRATTTIPIVMTNTADPVGTGLVGNLAHPDGNVTGLSTLSAELSAKRLELLREIVPAASRVAVLWDDTNPAFASAVRETQAAARSFGMPLSVFTARRADEIDRAFAAMVSERTRALIVVPGNVFLPERKRLVEAAARHRLPAAYAQSEYVDVGGLMAYGSNLSDLFARAASFVDRILKGAKPAQLPIEQPRKFELVINLKTAKVLGLTIPRSLLQRADQVIE
jgi:putative ABC transport system substrate-binding protein